MIVIAAILAAVSVYFFLQPLPARQLVNMISGNPYLGINLLLVLSFPLVGALAYISIRLIGLRGPLAVALALTFTFIPFHFSLSASVGNQNR